MDRELLPPVAIVSVTSGSKEYPYTDDLSTPEGALGHFYISNHADRVVAPPRPLPLITFPSRSHHATDRVNQLLGAEFEQKAFDVIYEIDIGVAKSAIHVSLVARMFRDNLSVSDIKPTVFIVVDAEWTAESREPWVVDELKRHIDQRITDTPSLDSINVCVEMASKALVLSKYLTFIDPEELGGRHLMNARPHIEKGIDDILESFEATRNCVTSIDLFRLGFNPEGSKNPKTVYVSVDDNSPAPSWPPVLDAMQRYVDTFDMDLKVHMEHSLHIDW